MSPPRSRPRSWTLAIAIAITPRALFSFEPKSNNDTELSPKWRWNLDVTRCNITRISYSDLIAHHGSAGLPPLYHEPLVVYDDSSTSTSRARRRTKFHAATSCSNLVEAFPSGFEVTLTSSNSLSERRKVMPLADYVREHVLATEVMPDSKSNETWYLFGETYTEKWKALLDGYVLPPCQTCEIEGATALAFGIGGVGSGVQWHVHGPGFSESVHGRKHWVLYPPKKTVAEFHKDNSSRAWMEETYMDMVRAEGEDGRSLPWECTLEEGEMIYFPDMWWHATINLDRYTVFVSSFTTEHNIGQ
uniref:JmjC domain-containing protein n=1 Tax=Corethron hystrix TaxID=216773 RepID=A0A7S1BMZ3_9STRA